MTLIPARYIGDHEVLLDIGQLKAARRPLVDGYGAPLKPTLSNAVDGLPAYGLRNGDTLMMPDYEVLGQTYLHDPHQQNPSELIGVGKVVKKEHEGLSQEELINLGYEWQGGRADFRPLNLIDANTTPDSVETPIVTESTIGNTPVEVPSAETEQE